MGGLTWRHRLRNPKSDTTFFLVEETDLPGMFGAKRAHPADPHSQSGDEWLAPVWVGDTVDTRQFLFLYNFWFYMEFKIP